jgi:plasmid stability protein
MGQLIVRKLEDSVKEALRLRARRHGVSLEEEVRNILRGAANEPAQHESGRVGLGTQIANLFRGIPDNDEPFELKLEGELRRVDFGE